MGSAFSGVYPNAIQDIKGVQDKPKAAQEEAASERSRRHQRTKGRPVDNNRYLDFFRKGTTWRWPSSNAQGTAMDKVAKIPAR